MKNLFFLGVLVIALLNFSPNISAQHSIRLSLAPSMLMDRADYQPADISRPLIIESKPALGFMFDMAYQHDFKKNFFINVGARILFLQSKVDFNIESSGFNSQSQIKYYDYSSYSSFDYFTGFGLRLQGGYKINTTQRTSLSINLGVHLDLPVVSNTGGNQASYSTGNGTQLVYYDNAMDGYNSVYYGVDGAICFHYMLRNNANLFGGIAASIDPNQYIKGTFVSYPNLPLGNAGTYSLKKDFYSLVFGINVPFQIQ